MIGKIREHGKAKNLIARQNTSHPSSRQQHNRRLTSNFHSIVTTMIPIFHSGREETKNALILLPIGQVTGERRDVIDHERRNSDAAAAEDVRIRRRREKRSEGF